MCAPQSLVGYPLILQWKYCTFKVRATWKRRNPMRDHLKATGIYLTHMAWVSLVLLIVGKQPFPQCCFQAALILLGLQSAKVLSDQIQLRTRPVRVQVRRTR
jgi:hypothetical protein